MGGLDINWFRVEKGHDPNIIRKSLERRFRDPKIVDTIIEKDQEWRKVRYQLDGLKMEWNNIGKAIRDKKKANKEDPCEEEIKLKNANELKQKQIEEGEAVLLKEIDKLISTIGNIVHDSVPVSNNEDNNEVVRTWGEIPALKITDKRGGLNHHKVLQALGGYDPERGQNVAGHRGYFLKGVGVLLNNALINYGINFLHKLGYDLLQPPFFLKKEIMAQTCQLSDFDDQLYKVSGETPEEDYYLIATSEQPISAMHRGEWLEESTLPIKYGGSSSCFRKEAGAHGKDTWGIFRVHQFQKIEQFCITKPEQSWQMLEEMIHHSEEFYKSLKLPYRVISIVSGALNDAAAKKYDLEAWFPGYEAYRELVSCSNCTDFQSRNLGIRLRGGKKEDAEKRFVHMLNGTLCATERTLCCILENYQTETGLRVPQVLQQFLGTDFLPYKEEEKPKQKKKQEKPKEPKAKKEKVEGKEEPKPKKEKVEGKEEPKAKKEKVQVKAQTAPKVQKTEAKVQVPEPKDK